MARHGGALGPWSARLLATATAGLVWITAGALRAWEPSPPDALLSDAELCDVCFLDPDRGWAVGDRGVIWHTRDGGRHWQLQTSPVACRLESVYFLDDRLGWIAGGGTQPYTHRSSGVLLRTRDGGQRWEEVPRLLLPALSRIRFFDARRGWAAGSPSDLYPAGVLTTTDGGLSWCSLAVAAATRWQSADFFDTATGVVAGAGGVVGRVGLEGLAPILPPRAELRAVHCVRCVPSEPVSAGSGQLESVSAPSRLQVAWAVGDGGLAMLTLDGGRSWRRPAGPLPEAIGQFDCRALALHNEACWIAGSPGSYVFHTPDGGRTWGCFSTGQSLPIRALTFLDHDRGWAVGALGTILATRDGGRSWRIQRQGSARAALLAIFASADRIPLELFAGLSGDEGYVSVVDVVTRPHSEGASVGAAPLAARTHEAVVAVGGSQAEMAWQFPLQHSGLRRSTATIVADWQRFGTPGREALETYAARQIRIWRPEVVITESASPRGDDPLGQMVNQAVLSAVEKARSETQFAEQIGAAGLTAWEVKKVFGSLGGDVAGNVNLTTSQLAPRLGGSLSDHARCGWQLLRTRSQPPPQTYGFRLLINRVAADVGQRDFFSGTHVTTGSEGRRMSVNPPPSDLRMLGRLAQQRRNTQQLLRRLAEATSGEAAWLGQVESLIRGLEPPAASELLFELAQSLQDAGRPDLAASVYDLLVRQNPSSPLCDAALIWLVQYHASSEAAWGGQRHRQTPPEATLAVAKVDAEADASSASATQPVEFPAPIGSQTGSSLDSPAMIDHQRVTEPGKPLRDQLEQRAQRAAFYGQLIQHARPALYSAPEVRFPLTIVGRQAGDGRELGSYFRSLAGARREDAWPACANAELWLSQSGRPAPKAVLECRRTSQRPRLDGRLDDEAWRDCLPANLIDIDADKADWPAAVMLTYDEEFLFVAARCCKAPGALYPSAGPRRSRDPDLNDRDRIELLIDVDRDYSTYYRLAIDHRGWALDECVGVVAWDPDWYIAAAEDESSWTIEAAMPWSELCAQPPDDRTVWALGLQRVIPGAGFQSWSRPADPAVTPTGFGLLRFR